MLKGPGAAWAGARATWKQVSVGVAERSGGRRPHLRVQDMGEKRPSLTVQACKERITVWPPLDGGVCWASKPAGSLSKGVSGLGEQLC